VIGEIGGGYDKREFEEVIRAIKQSQMRQMTKKRQGYSVSANLAKHQRGNPLHLFKKEEYASWRI
jgi:hypothetical protein